MARSVLTRRLAPLAALVLAALWAAAAVATPAPFGVNIHAPGGADVARLLDATSSAGLQVVRVDMVWAFIEPQRGQFDWSAYDAIADAAAARGIQVLAIHAYTPGWATDGPAWSGVPRDPADWQDFCSRAAQRYAGRIAYFELWNEPNQPAFWSGSVDQYIDIILAPGADAIPAASPLALAGGPALAHLASRQWYDWLLTVLQRAGSRLDFITHHVYDSDGDAAVTDRLTGSTQFANYPDLWSVQPPSVRELLKYAGFQGRTFFLTETGWASDQVGEDRQAQYLDGFLQTWFTGQPGNTWISAVFVYEMQDGSQPPDWGLLRADGTAKPAYTAYSEFAHAHGGGTDGGALGLLGGRFAVTARWRNPQDNSTGVGHAVPFTDASGLFWFFDPSNVELVVKALDGGPVNGKYWLFYGALSNVEYWLTVTDRSTGAVKQYHNPAGTLCGKADTGAFPHTTAAGFAAPAPSHLATAASAACVADALHLCLASRFRVQVAWRDPTGRTGNGTAIPGTRDSGYFWFFAPGNIELVVKALDGTGVNGHFWVLWGGLSNVRYEITVTDTQTGVVKRYLNRQGNYCGGSDVNAF